uniref:(northern house mosquito) hypothetical protein n=1 Tax=Culex pipiens TaxID=7175 RepID=A0A8D8FJD3_CULPI
MMSQELDIHQKELQSPSRAASAFGAASFNSLYCLVICLINVVLMCNYCLCASTITTSFTQVEDTKVATRIFGRCRMACFADVRNLRGEEAGRTLTNRDIVVRNQRIVSCGCLSSARSRR